MNTKRYARFEAGISNTGELVITFTPSSLDGLTVEQAVAVIAGQPWVLRVWRGDKNPRWLWVEPTADAAKLNLIDAASRALQRARRALGVDEQGRKAAA